jgi:hypothetical protein
MFTGSGTKVHLLKPVEWRSLQKSINLLPSQLGAIVRIRQVPKLKHDLFEARRRYVGKEVCE